MIDLKGYFPLRKISPFEDVTVLYMYKQWMKLRNVYFKALLLVIYCKIYAFAIVILYICTSFALIFSIYIYIFYSNNLLKIIEILPLLINNYTTLFYDTSIKLFALCACNVLIINQNKKWRINNNIVYTLIIYSLNKAFKNAVFFSKITFSECKHMHTKSKIWTKANSQWIKSCLDTSIILNI